MPTPNKYGPGGKPINRIEIHNVEGKVKRKGESVVLELYPAGGILELHFGDPDQLMNFWLLMIEEMAKVFPEHEASKLWLDDTFK